MDTRTLVLLRHAKTESGDGKQDVDRELTNRGCRDAAEAGRLLHDRFPDGVDLVHCSIARRTRQTWDQVSQAGVQCGDVRHEEQAYNASADELLALVRDQTPDQMGTVVLLGHSPGIPDLLGVLADPAGSAVRVPARYGTCGVAVLELGTPWSNLAPGTARLTSFDQARG